jgi:hypothetical protein
MNKMKNWPYMLSALCFFLALLMFIFSLAAPVGAAASAHLYLP